MSVEIRAKIICDTCGRWIDGPVARNTTCGMETYWKAKGQAMRERWLIQQRYGKTKHICNYCADGMPSQVIDGKQGKISP